MKTYTFTCDDETYNLITNAVADYVSDLREDDDPHNNRLADKVEAVEFEEVNDADSVC